LELADRELSFNVSPVRATIVYSFQEQSKSLHTQLVAVYILPASILVSGTWTVEALSAKLSSSPSSIRKHLGYWVGQGVLREESNDTFTVIEKRSEKSRNYNIGMRQYAYYVCCRYKIRRCGLQ